MAYLYHNVPENMAGNTLYPLNQLKDKHPEIYQKEASKYTGREHIMEHVIPGLNCLWNDVLHFTAVNPQKIKQVLAEAGRTGFTLRYYQIDPKMLEPENTIVYLYKHTEKENKFKPDNFAPYNPDNLKQYSQLPNATKNYYKKTINQGNNPLLYHRVPHILYQDSLNVRDLPVVSV